MSLQEIATGAAPGAIGPYSQAVRKGSFVFCSGQIPIDPSTGELIEGTIEDQTDRVLRNLSAVLEAAGSTLRDVVKTTVYLADMGDFAAMNEVYSRFFEADPAPARAAVEVAALPKGARVEIDAIALLD